MTAQIHDRVIYHNDKYEIAGIKGIGLITPQQFGITPRFTSSVNWRGFYCTYTIDHGMLYLTEMAVDSDTYPPIQGVLPVTKNDDDSPTYYGLSVPVPFSGFLLIVRALTDEISRYMGFEYTYSGMQNYFEYQTVFELQFETSKLRQAADHSARMSALRSQLVAILEARAATIQPVQKQYDELRKEQLTTVLTPGNDDWQKYNALEEPLSHLRQQLEKLDAVYSAKAEQILKPFLLDYDEL